jgi:hypothetical protein
MPIFARKPEDALAAQQKKLEAELARLQSQLGRLASEPPPPIPPRPADQRPNPAPFAPPLAPPPAPAEPGTVHGHFNELGVRKWDLAAAWQKLTNHLQGPTGNNPRLTKMLAAGSIHGLRPLRHEKRVARNRFIALFVTLFLILVGVAHVYLRNSR